MRPRVSGLRKITRLGLAGLAVLAAAGAAAQSPPPENCGPLSNNYGPYDYRTDRKQLPVVENAHFTPAIESLTKGKSGRVIDELTYTLRAFPNHYRALVSITNWSLRRAARSTIGDLGGQPDYSPECYFDRAMRFRPDDVVVRMLYADFLTKHKRPQDAIVQLDRVRDMPEARERALTQHNIGLLYLQAGKPSEALKQAHTAMAMGLKRDDLAAQLRSKGQWRDPSPATLAGAASAPAAAAATASAPAASAAPVPAAAASSSG